MDSRAPKPVPALSSEVLEEIFLRIGSPADLVRASAASPAFRRLISDQSFLRTYRSLHPAPLLGLLDCNRLVFQPAEAPHPSAALARTVARAADFSFDGCLPRVTGDWMFCALRGGRVLFSCPRDDEEDVNWPSSFMRVPAYLAVCDPLARRCLVLPPISDDLLASVQDDTSFRVIGRIGCKEKMAAVIFSSAAGHWTAGTSVTLDTLGMQRSLIRTWDPSYAYGCFYWKLSCANKWLKFDMSSMEFSAVALPSVCSRSCVIIGEAGEGRLRMFRLINDRTSLCYRVVTQIGGEWFDQLKMDNIIPLREGSWYHIHGPYDGHIFISSYQSPDERHGADTCFAVEMKTLKIERVCQMRFCEYFNPYFSFPPFMSPRRV
ncbi:hypothetical protein BS78_02G246000 [Paspalum vaginatum]|nr:hypothetical protein BS78_02G246000 [Paspalum vaginatum]